MRAYLLFLVVFTLASPPAGTALANPVQAVIDEAVGRGEAVAVIPPGEYRLESAVMLRGLSGFTLDAEGARFVFTNLRNGGVSVSDCERLTLKGFTVDYDPLPFTQATITAIDLARLTVSFTVHDGYPDFGEPYFRPRSLHAFAFQASTRQWLAAAPDLYGRSVKLHSPRVAELTFGASHADRLKALSVGDYLAFGARGGRGIRMERTNDIHLTGVTLHSAPGIAVTARFMDGKNVFTYRIARGPTPLGATIPRLLSTSADGFNYAYARTGPIIENCDFAWMGDDSVNIHGIAFYVSEVTDEGRTVNVLRPYGAESFASVIRTDDEILALDQTSFDVTGRARVRGFAAVPEIDAEHLAVARKVWPWISGRATLYQIATDRPLDLKPGDFVEIPAISGPGYTIRDNRFGNHRGRGLRLMAGHGLVENNLIEHVAQAGITLGPEMVLFREAGWVNDVIVRRNTLRHVGFDPQLLERGAWTPGAIATIYRGASPGAPRPRMRHQRIHILDNVIEDVGVAAIHINQTADARVTGNRIARVNRNPAAHAGSAYGLSAVDPVCVQHSLRVLAEDNPVDAPAAAPAAATGRVLRVDARDPSALSLKAAADAAAPGDIIFIEPGSGPYREPLHVRRSGEPAAPITIEGNGNEITGFAPLVFRRDAAGVFHADIPAGPANAADTAFVLRHRGRRLPQDAATGRFHARHGSSPVEWDAATRRLTLTDTTQDAEKDWEISSRHFAVRVHDVSNHHYKNIVATGATNDGFNLHGAGGNLRFENIVGAQNLDEGFSAHGDIVCEIVRGEFHENDNGILNVDRSRLRAVGLDVRDNLGLGVGVTHRSVIELADARIWGNGVRQLSVRAEARAVLDPTVTIHTPVPDRRRWIGYKESREWTPSSTIEIQSTATLIGEPTVVDSPPRLTPP